MPLTSLEGQLSQKIIARIEAEIPEIKHVDLNLGQLDNYEVKPAVEFPCALFDFSEEEFTQMQGGQRNDLIIEFDLAFDVVDDTSGFAPGTVQEAGLNYFEIEHKFYQKFQYWVADGLVFNEFRRSRKATVNNGDPFRRRKISFRASAYDTSAG